MTSTAVRPSIAAGTYRIDPARTTVRFDMREMFGLKPVQGTFTVRDGTVVVGADPQHSCVRVEMDPARFKTDKARRDKDILSDKWLDPAGYPEMSYVGDRLTESPEGWRLSGELTVHGVTAPVDLVLLDGAQTAGGVRFTATATVDRAAFNLGKAIPFVGRMLTVTIEVGATRA